MENDLYWKYSTSAGYLYFPDYNFIVNMSEFAGARVRKIEYPTEAETEWIVLIYLKSGETSIVVDVADEEEGKKLIKTLWTDGVMKFCKV